MKRIELIFFALTLGLVFATKPAFAENQPTLEEVRAIAKEAYIYGYPMVEGYRIQYAYFADAQSPEFKAPWNTIRNISRVFGPADKMAQAPNSDTPYSFIGLDLRTEPVVITVPAIESNRYFSVQFIDLYSHNFDYIGSRTTGNGGGVFLVAGPGWKGETPKGMTKVIRSETELALAIFRTQLFHPGDIENVKTIQQGYKAQLLSAYLGEPAPDAAPAISFRKPLTRETQKTSLEFYNILSFVLQFCPTHPTETELMTRFAAIGVGAGRSIDIETLDPETKSAIEAGMADAWAAFAEVRKLMEAGGVNASEAVGTRESLKNNYLYRMLAAAVGIFGNSKQEAMYPFYTVDAQKEKLDASKHSYTLCFAPGQLPPAHAFWSVTLYELPSNLLSSNVLNRYLINSAMMPDLKTDADGSLTIYVQNTSPGADKESNWLPAPNGPFMMVLRIYWPKPEAVDGTWKRPPLTPHEID